MKFATKQRLLLGIAVLLMFTPTFLYSAGLLGQPPLYDGDVRKEMTCLTCDGLGTSAEKESCGTCRGRGVADFIIPGPNRPQQLVGTVFNASGETIEGADIAVHVSGAVPGEGGVKELLFKTNPDGQFGVKLPVGEYVIKASVEGGTTTQESIVIESNPTPLPASKMETLHKIEQEFRLP
jgi:hypothetical protein